MTTTSSSNVKPRLASWSPLLHRPLSLVDPKYLSSNALLEHCYGVAHFSTIFCDTRRTGVPCSVGGRELYLVSTDSSTVRSHGGTRRSTYPARHSVWNTLWSRGGYFLRWRYLYMAAFTLRALTRAYPRTPSGPPSALSFAVRESEGKWKRCWGARPLSTSPNTFPSGRPEEAC